MAVKPLEVFVVETVRTCKFACALDWVQSIWGEEDYAKARRYADLMRKGEVFPPIKVFGGTVYDGFHRISAHIQLCRHEIDVIDFKNQPDPYD